MTYSEATQIGQENADKFQTKMVLLRNTLTGGFIPIYWTQWCNGVQPPYKMEVVSLIEPA